MNMTIVINVSLYFSETGFRKFSNRLSVEV